MSPAMPGQIGVTEQGHPVDRNGDEARAVCSCRATIVFARPGLRMMRPAIIRPIATETVISPSAEPRGLPRQATSRVRSAEISAG